MPQSMGCAGGFFFPIFVIENRFVGDLDLVDVGLPPPLIVIDATAAAATTSAA